MAERVARTVGLRSARAGDCRLFWEWRNHPSARRNAFDEDEIPYEDHVAWFTLKLDDPTARMLVIMDAGGRDIGYVRCDIEDGEGEVSVALAADAQGQGYGTAALREAAARLLAEPTLSRLRARIRRENIASLIAFERAGFVRVGVTRKGDDEIDEFVAEQSR